MENIITCRSVSGAVSGYIIDGDCNKDSYRVLFASDIHNTELIEWYGRTNSDRMRAWVEAVNAEHTRRPIDLILMLGDYSLDFWGGNGTIETEGKSDAAAFMRDYVSGLPENVPVFAIEGNHEKYGCDKWEEITGNTAQGTVVLGDNVFVLLDTFDNATEPDYDNYRPADTAYIREQLALYPQKRFWLCGHWFELSLESEDFRELLCENRNISGAFMGHSHFCDVRYTDDKWGNTAFAQTGNYSYTNGTDRVNTFWGFRELVITPDSAVSGYIVADSYAAPYNGEIIHIERRLTDEIRFY